MAGQQRQQVAALLNFNLFNFMGLDALNVGHGIGQRFPQVGELYSIAHMQAGLCAGSSPRHTSPGGPQ